MKRFFRVTAVIIAVLFTFSVVALAAPANKKDNQPPPQTSKENHQKKETKKPTKAPKLVKSPQKAPHDTTKITPKKHNPNTSVIHHQPPTSPKEQSGDRKKNTRHDSINNHRSRDNKQHYSHGWPPAPQWQRQFREWSWLSSHNIHNLNTYHSNQYHERVSYLHFEPDHRFFGEVERRYGHYHHHERRFMCDGYGSSYYWFNPEQIVCVFVRDDGYVRSFIWYRSEFESQVIAAGLVAPDFIASYRQYNDDIPSDVANTFINVLWAVTAYDE